MEERQKMSWFIGVIVFMAFIIYPVRKKEKKRINHVPFYDYILAAVGAGSFFYYAINCEAIVAKASRITEIDIAIAIVGTLLLFEACRRVVGLPIVCVSAAFIAYAFLVVDRNPLRVIMYKLFYTTEGIAGTPLNVCASFIVLFIIFAGIRGKRRRLVRPDYVYYSKRVKNSIKAFAFIGIFAIMSIGKLLGA